MADKPHMNLVFVGHVDHGKSTTVGRLLFDGGAIEEQQMRKLKERAEELGKGGFEFAFVMDNLKEERERGVTIDISHKEFTSDKYFFTIIDAPGHADFVKNMITGASQADAGVLVVSGNPSDGVQTQTREHAWLCRTYGVAQLVVAVNKMDLANFDEARFKAVQEEVSELLKTSGYDISKIKFVPVASLNGDNIVNKSDKTSWYTGPTLMEALNELAPPEKPTNLPLRLPLQQAYDIKGIGAVPVGKLETGVMKVNDEIIITPAKPGTGVTGIVKSIEMHHKNHPQAEAGDNVGFTVRGIKKSDIERGDVVGHKANPPTVVSEFTAHIVVRNHPSVITIGYTPVFHIHTAQVACQVTEIVKTVNPATGETVAEKPDTIKTGDSAIVKVKPAVPLVIEKNSDIPQLSRFAIRDSGATVAVGICIDITKK